MSRDAAALQRKTRKTINKRYASFDSRIYAVYYHQGNTICFNVDAKEDAKVIAMKWDKAKIHG